MSRRPILVVEDDDDIRETLKDLLEIEGFAVVTAENGEVALGMLERLGLPCLILLDLMMPVMDGWRFLEITRGLPDAPVAKVPVTVVSAAAELSELSRRYGCGVLTKPLDPEVLIEIARSHCECAA